MLVNTMTEGDTNGGWAGKAQQHRREPATAGRERWGCGQLNLGTTGSAVGSPMPARRLHGRPPAPTRPKEKRHDV